MKNLARITGYLAKIYRDPPERVSGGSLDDFRRDIIAGPHGISKYQNSIWFLRSFFCNKFSGVDFNNYCKKVNHYSVRKDKKAKRSKKLNQPRIYPVIFNVPSDEPFWAGIQSTFSAIIWALFDLKLLKLDFFWSPKCLRSWTACWSFPSWKIFSVALGHVLWSHSLTDLMHPCFFLISRPSLAGLSTNTGDVEVPKKTKLKHYFTWNFLIFPC